MCVVENIAVDVADASVLRSPEFQVLCLIKMKVDGAGVVTVRLISEDSA